MTVGCGPVFALGCGGKGGPWLEVGECADGGLCKVGVRLDYKLVKAGWSKQWTRPLEVYKWV